MLRDDLDDILNFIGAESLTDEEYATVDIQDENVPTEVYAALLAVINGRELVSNMAARLRFYFMAQGVTIGDNDRAKSNIFVGSGL